MSLDLNKMSKSERQEFLRAASENDPGAIDNLVDKQNRRRNGRKGKKGHWRVTLKRHTTILARFTVAIAALTLFAVGLEVAAGNHYVGLPAAIVLIFLFHNRIWEWVAQES